MVLQLIAEFTGYLTQSLFQFLVFKFSYLTTFNTNNVIVTVACICLLYTSDAADE